MKTRNILKGLVITLFLAFTFTFSSCSGYDVDIIEELAVDREFAPVALKAIVRNQTTVELNWTVNEEVDYYIVEFSADDPTFATIYKSIEVRGEELPVQVALEGETVYSIRVKAISAVGLEDSKWAVGEATTLTEQLMLSPELGDIKALEATFRWVPNSNVTQIVINPGDIKHEITAQEKIDGIATVTGLTSETDYTALLLNNTKTKGKLSFTTGIDVGDNTLVTVDDDLFQMIADAAPGDILLLEAGDYTAQTGLITLNKSITIQGLRSYNKPLLKVSFALVDGATDVSLIDLDLEGDVPLELTNTIDFAGAGNFNSLLISGCNIHNYDKSLIKGQVMDAIVQNVTIENCIVTDVRTNSSDFIDFRNSDVLNLTVTKSTFNNCAPSREFIRIDNTGTSNGNSTCNILVDSCTIYACSVGRKILYVRFDANIITVTNNLFAETTSAVYTNKKETSQPTFDNNNYFNASGLTTSNGFAFDDSATYTELDPGFTDAATGNFKVSNQTILDNQVGDPRWLQ